MHLRIAPLVLVASVSAGTACGDGPGGTDSGGTDSSAADAGPDTSFTVAAPDIPWLDNGVPPIAITPCPRGWHEVTERDVTVCDPYPPGGRRECGLGEAHFPGESGCRPVGHPCPTGAYATTLPDDGSVVYVTPDAAPGGDGSLGLPYAALSEVPWATLTDATVALGRGTFSGTLALNAGVQVVGACASETILAGAADDALAVVSAREAGPASLLQDVTIAAPPQWGVLAADGASLEIRGVVFDRALQAGVAASHPDTTVTLVDTVIRETRRDPSEPIESMGVFVSRGAHVDATRTLLLGNHDYGARVAGRDSELMIRDSVFWDSREASSNDGIGVTATSGSRLSLARVLMKGASTGVLAMGLDTTVGITDSVITEAWYDPEKRLGGQAINALDESAVDLMRVLLSGHEASAILAADPTSVTLTDSVIRGARETDAAGSSAFSLVGGARIDASRVLIESTVGFTAFASGEGTALILTDVAARDSRPPSSTTEPPGRGLIIQDGALVEASRLLIEHVYDVGILVAGEGARVHVIDSVIRDTLAPPDGSGGRGIGVQEGGHFDGLRLLVAESHDLGIFGAGPTTVLELADAAVFDTMPNTNDNSEGRGIVIQNRCHLEGSRVVVDGAFRDGIGAYSGANIDLQRASISQVRASPCEPGVCSGAAAGFGLTVVGAAARLNSFAIREAETCGVFVALPSSGPLQPAVDLQSGEVTGSGIGACVQVEGYDISRLSNDVLYYDNTTNLDSTMLAVPAPPETIARSEP